MDTQSSTVQSSGEESSKTDSSKSAGDEVVTKDRDFTKDNSASPIDLECHIQEERITKLLNQALLKVKLAICLPNLIEDHTLMSSISRGHFDDIMFIYEQYEHPLFSPSADTLAVLNLIQEGNLTLKHRLNPELAHLISILMAYPSLEDIVEELITQMKANNTSHANTAGVRFGLKFLHTLEHFRDLMIRQMETTAAAELADKLRIRNIESSNQTLLSDIKEYTECLKNELESFEKTMEQKVKLIADLEQELQYLLNEANVKLKKKILDSDRQMVLASRRHAVKFEVLKEESTDCTETYATILKNNLINEKNLRMRRFKVETQLMSWLQKYDTEMADKQEEFDDFDDKYKEEKERCEELDKKIAEQDVEYLPLMAEREEEYHQEMTNKMKAFMRDHAARVIQYCWREVLQNRAEKKKLKKIQARMRAAAEAEKKKGGKKK